MGVYFFRPGDNSDYVKYLEEMFVTSEYLKIAVAYFNNKKFSEIIIERTKKKQVTYLLVNTSDMLRPQKYGDTRILISESLLDLLNFGRTNDYLHIRSLGLRDKGKYHNMHHKFFLNREEVMFGSVNLTDAALERNYELLVKSNDQNVINDFDIEFNQLWELGSDIYTGQDKKIRRIMCPKCEVSDGVDFESYGPFCTHCGYKFYLD